MTDLDPTAARANTPKLSREAREAKAKADRKAFLAAVGRAAAWVWKRLPVALVLAIGVSLLVSATIFDWYMSSRGWLDILPGLGFFAWFGAAASVGFWYFGAPKTRDEIAKQLAIEDRKKRRWGEAYLWGVIAAIAYLICVGGVIVATITNTSQAKFAAEESRKEFAALRAERDALAEELELYSTDYWQQRLDADDRQRKGQLNIAKATLGMKDLDVDGGCAQKLSFDQRRACALYNGGLDPHQGVEVIGILAQIEQDEAGYQKAEDATFRLLELESAVDNFTVKTGDETARSLGDWFGSESAGNQILLGFIIFLSAGFLLCGGLFGDWVIRRLIGKAL